MLNWSKILLWRPKITNIMLYLLLNGAYNFYIKKFKIYFSYLRKECTYFLNLYLDVLRLNANAAILAANTGSQQVSLSNWDACIELGEWWHRWILGPLFELLRLLCLRHNIDVSVLFNPVEEKFPGSVFEDTPFPVNNTIIILAISNRCWKFYKSTTYLSH